MPSNSSSSSDSNTVLIGGMNGGQNGVGAYFADNPVVITISGLAFPEDSPIKVCLLDVLYNNSIIGKFSGEVSNANSISFDISSAIRTLWSEYDFTSEIEAALQAGGASCLRAAKAYSLKVYTEYISNDGSIATVESGEYAAGSCILGGLTEMERSGAIYYDVSAIEGQNLYNGDASTKPHSSPERVGSNSITSWVDIGQAGTTCYYYPASATPGQPSSTPHAPIVIRDTVPYMDFLFVNRRGAVETCSAKMLESLDISVETKQYARSEAPTYKPSRSIMTVASGGRRSWSMSSGYQTREWAEWWALEFLMARRHWMLYKGKYVPVTVTPSKKATSIYDRTKQQMPSVEFTVTLALEG